MISALESFLLSNDEMETRQLTKEVFAYIKDSDDFLGGCIKYFVFINKEFNLDFKENEVFQIVGTLLSYTIQDRMFTKPTSLHIFVKFIYCCVFNFHLPNPKMNSIQVIEYFLNIKKIDNPKNPMITHTLDKGKIQIFTNKLAETNVAPSRKETHPLEYESRIFGLKNGELTLLGLGIFILAIIWSLNYESADFPLFISAIGGIIFLIGFLRLTFNVK